MNKPGLAVGILLRPPLAATSAPFTRSECSTYFPSTPVRSSVAKDADATTRNALALAELFVEEVADFVAEALASAFKFGFGTVGVGPEPAGTLGVF